MTNEIFNGTVSELNTAVSSCKVFNFSDDCNNYEVKHYFDTIQGDCYTLTVTDKAGKYEPIVLEHISCPDID